MLQAGAIKKDYRLSQHKQEWSQFKVDLENMMSWLDEAEALQRTHKPLPGEITKLDTIIRQHKVIQSTLVISKLKGPSETLRDIRTLTYQIFRIEENPNRTTKFHKLICNLTPLVRIIY